MFYLHKTVMISTAKTTTAQKLSTKKYLSFSDGLTYSIDAESMMIEKIWFDDVLDISKFGTELSIDGYEYSVQSVLRISFESKLFKRYIERSHNILHYSHNISIYLNKNERAIAIRLMIDEEMLLVELF